MTDPITYVELALPELSGLVADADGDPGTLNAPAGFSSYFQRADVVELGREIQAARRTELGEDEAAALADYFETAGALITHSRFSLTAHSTSRPGETAIYFPTSEGSVEILLLDGQTLLTVHAGPLTVATLLERHPADDDDVLIVGRFDDTGERRHLAVCRGVAAYSPDGDTWQAPDPDQPRERNDIVREFVTGVAA